mmetsp:Transcript_4206/g.8486  ORF Transcript_4206/g.8486 Transcript_4206/m.8486 type:complete len:833 (+) Transcript_4206:135-2633(+)|eukprot:CAMPEP_0118644544 /NCGR_PEP_ID=MMETSP0785-20121206/7004_1 /TAXON_ID=91992 /ORGANISM="Bolidomonas pacifica, Strain CCMP 1866" /LENGTH=832 /DNA_ID=CAMNT_0006536327 /DNA_START=288 /DNA_END=2783 /DNA_ORIENTATION=+
MVNPHPDNEEAIVPPEGGGEGGEAPKNVHKSVKAELKEAFLDKVLKSKEFNILMVILTVYALFGDDIRLAFYEVDDDQIFYTISTIAMFMFIIEMMLQFYFREEYRWGFYFLLDILSTSSMIPDTNLLTDALIDDGGGAGGEDAASTMKAGKTSRAGAKAGRVVKIVRLIRFVRIFKILKMRKQVEDDKETTDEGKSLEAKLEEEPSKVGKKLTELTVRRVIVIVLAMIMIFPILDDPNAFFGETEFTSYEKLKIFDLHNMTDSLNKTGNITDEFFKEQVQTYAKKCKEGDGSDQGKDIIYLKLNRWPVETTNAWIKEVMPGHPLLVEVPEPDGKYRRSDARMPAEFPKTCEMPPPGDPEECYSYAYYDLSVQNKLASAVSLVKTILIVLCLSIAVISFSRDAETLVIDPIERMIKLVKKLADNPLASLYQDQGKEGTEGFETTLLETTLEKISSLLQVGFGVAGAQIIQSNMGTGGDLDVMIPGKKITAVFGFGIMEEFTNTCSCLEEEMCTYINTIAKIIHDNATAYHGAPNKNIGSAFLLVWKICDGVLPGLRDLRDASVEELKEEKKSELRKNIGVMSKGAGDIARKLSPQELVDSALVGVLKMRVDLSFANGEGGTLEEFKKNKKLVDYYNGTFQVDMGFGLHIGWAIEGAIGSNYKIDASYLSPNVNMAARLEAATHQFGTPLLVSGPFVNEMSRAAKSMCRKIDVVTVKGSQIPLELWTCDISNFDTDCLAALTPRIVEGEQKALDVDVIKKGIQKEFDLEFKRIFEEGIDFYIKGDWEQARNRIDKCLGIYGGDGPCNCLSRVMDREGGKAPDDWRGFRELTSK